jgi:CelD/BcsL family acetyltransferase involved in cellulose biosynthesis
VPIAADASDEELVAWLSRRGLGRAWRLGPAYADDNAAQRLAALAPRAGWQVLRRRLGTAYYVDLAGLASRGDWPSSKTLRKNRWLERRLAESGPLEFQTVSGDDWDDSVIETLRRIEGESWVGKRADPNDTKFLHAPNRDAWKRALADSVLAERLCCSTLSIGGEPAAFTFRIRAGATMHIIANSYSERFTAGSPGRVLLYRDLQQAMADGVRTVGWGAGDAGYKTEMGAEPGPEIMDLLFVRGRPLAALARLCWERSQ